MVNNSLFNNINTYSDAPVALLKLLSIQVYIYNCTFTTISNLATSSFGGVIKATSVGALTFDTVTA